MYQSQETQKRRTEALKKSAFSSALKI